MTPLGSVVAQLQWGADKAFLLSNGQTKESASLDAIVQEIAGTTLPITSLFDWLNGRPSAAQGWQVDLSALDKGRVFARRDVPAPAVEFRLALTRQ